MSKIAHVALITIGVFLGCNSSTSNLQELDLLSHGLPIKIMAPEGVEIKFDDLGIVKDMTISHPDNFGIQIFSQDAKFLEASRLLEEEKTLVEGSTYFSEIKYEDDAGFIFEKKIDDDYVNYDFRRIKIRGDQQYLFRALLAEKYTLDQIRVMYDAVE